MLLDTLYLEPRNFFVIYVCGQAQRNLPVEDLPCAALRCLTVGMLSRFHLFVCGPLGRVLSPVVLCRCDLRASKATAKKKSLERLISCERREVNRIFQVAEDEPVAMS